MRPGSIRIGYGLRGKLQLDRAAATTLLDHDRASFTRIEANGTAQQKHREYLGLLACAREVLFSGRGRLSCQIVKGRPSCASLTPAEWGQVRSCVVVTSRGPACGALMNRE